MFHQQLFQIKQKRKSLYIRALEWWDKHIPLVGQFKGLVGNFPTTLYVKKYFEKRRYPAPPQEVQ